jgi:hypothetical protein
MVSSVSQRVQKYSLAVPSLLAYVDSVVSTLGLLCLLPALWWFLTWLTLWPGRWRQYVLQKHQLTFTRPHGAVFHKIKLFFQVYIVITIQDRRKTGTYVHCGFTWCVQIVVIQLNAFMVAGFMLAIWSWLCKNWEIFKHLHSALYDPEGSSHMSDCIQVQLKETI